LLSLKLTRIENNTINIFKLIHNSLNDEQLRKVNKKMKIEYEKKDK
jgi:hypothetical protein